MQLVEVIGLNGNARDNMVWQPETGLQCIFISIAYIHYKMKNRRKKNVVPYLNEKLNSTNLFIHLFMVYKLIKTNSLNLSFRFVFVHSRMLPNIRRSL